MYPYVKPYKTRAILALLITLPIGSMDAVIAWVLKPYMDTVMIEKSVQATSLIPILIILFSLLQSLLNYGATYLNTWVGNRITMDLKMTLFKKMMRKDPAFFDKTNSGEILFRFNNDADTACSGLLSNLKLFSTRLFSSISLIFVLFYNSWQLAIIALIVLFGALYPLSTVRKRIKDLMSKNVVSASAILTHYNEAFSGNRVVASFNLYDYQNKRFKETLRQMFKIVMKMTKKTGLLTPMMHFIISIGIAGVIWLGSYLIMNNQLSPGGFVSFITALLMLYHPIKSIGTNFTNVQFSFMAMERIFAILEQKTTLTTPPNAKILTSVENVIEFKNVTFGYTPNKPVLKDINITVNKGQTIALVGNSGGGKSTLVSLLTRFYDIQNGSIEIDGTNIRNLNLDSLRSQIAFVFQDNILFAGTIRENILLGNKNASETELKEAVKNACLDEFIASLPLGLDTRIGERGTTLSGGQRQRIAIARAFIKNAPIVVLDEATSALDNKSEGIVQQAIYNLMNDRTVFIIAHRLSTVRNADKIAVINHGVLAEIGTHDELIAKENSIYASLYQTQLK
ncbi:MAG: ABC transporter ATP-binding protein [Alphaproteobacteria bacterium]|nr:ABC transporter ATP-binding protein [Alphaproteobacteria bacterium]